MKAWLRVFRILTVASMILSQQSSRALPKRVHVPGAKPEAGAAARSDHLGPFIENHSYLYAPADTSRCPGKTLKIYFPSNADELHAIEVERSQRRDWVDTLLGPNQKKYNLRGKIEERGCPVLFLGSCQLTLSPTDLETALQQSGMDTIEVISHSGGYRGLESSVDSWGAKTWAKISKITLLDTFYSDGLNSKLTSIREAYPQIACGGFFSVQPSYPKVAPRARRARDQFCPELQERKLEQHKTAVKEFL